MKLGVKVQLALVLLKETFGDAIAKIAEFLVKRHKSPLRIIRGATKLPLKQVKLGLAIGVQHNFIVISQHKRGFNEYSLDINAILHRIRYPLYIYYTKLLYGSIAEVLVEELLHRGQSLHSNLIRKTLEKINKISKEKALESQVEDKLQALIDSRFVEICPELPEKPSEDAAEPPPSKRPRQESSENMKRCYKICVNRFDLYLRDLKIIDAVSRKFSPKHGVVMSTMLRLSEVKTNPGSLESVPLTANEIFNSLPKDHGITSKAVLDVYLLTLCDDEMGIVTKAGESGGGSFVIMFSQSMLSIGKAEMEALVLERFGSKSLRIFRILLLKQHLEQKQIEELAMVPSKIVKELLFNMFAQKFVAVTEVSKTSDHAPARTFYCFKVPIESLIKQLLDWNYKSIVNLIIKRSMILNENRRLLDKQQKVEAIIATLTDVGEEQKKEIENMITPSEKSQLNLTKLQTSKLESGELQLAANSLLWEMNLLYMASKRF